jgi:NAD(P)-dependent dehydrogenase (short-subunit alcohol dehydrogenase family)
MTWTPRDIPRQNGRTAVVTGANSGIGYVTARELARHGARVVLGCRREQRGRAALDRLRGEVPEARVALRPLDLADLKSVRAFAEDFPGDHVDLLINNAGLTAVPYARTADGFEMQFGVNHLGHFALTGLLLDRLLAAAGARVVTVSSMMHAAANIDIGDLGSERHYRRWQAYARSKTANLLFVHELARRAAGKDLTVAAAHPGHSATEPRNKGARIAGRRVTERVMRLGNRLVASTPDQGAAPTLYAATAPGVRPDSFFGPRVLNLRGAPGPSPRAPWTKNDVAGERLWEASEHLTGVSYPALS